MKRTFFYITTVFLAVFLVACEKEFLHITPQDRLTADNFYRNEGEIKAAISNLCPCGVYPRLVRAIERAGRVARREETISAAPAPGPARRGPPDSLRSRL